MRTPLLFGAMLAFVIGCGSQKLASVSGRVTLDDKPLGNAMVSFEPSVQERTMEAPLASFGKTNDNGEYTLETKKGEKGAVTGKHKVTISLLNPEIGGTDERPPRGGWPIKDKVPEKYNTKTELTREVKPGANTENFELKSK